MSLLVRPTAAFWLWKSDFVCRLQGARYLFGMGPLPVAGHLSLSGTLWAWSGIGHTVTPDICHELARPLNIAAEAAVACAVT